MSKVRIIAIYLPQYHPIPENDLWWGKGFTEWTNVGKARPLFRGHYQPRVPADLGYYDLRMPEIREAQAQMARDAGIEGFMYWQYYFGIGEKLLERPFEEVLASGKPNFPFCLGWANHSWQTKTWKCDTNHRKGQTMIKEQKYGGEKQYIDHFKYNLLAFKDKRYMKVDGKPIFVIWNPKDRPEELSLLIKIWRKLALENGLRGIHFVCQCNVDINLEYCKSLGFDAIYQGLNLIALNGGKRWPIWKKINQKLSTIFNKTFILNKADFGKRYKLLVNDEAKRNDVYPSLLAGYDRSPRAGRAAQIFYNFTPKTWRLHVKNLLEYVEDKDYENNLVFLKSWNEWGESNYIEPDIKYGTAMLEVLKEEISNKD